METSNKYEIYPIWIVFLSNLTSLSIYALGFFILMKLGWVAPAIYMVLVFILEYRLIRNHCVNCFYWGKTCGFGKGRISSLFFKRGDISKFCNLKMTWRDMIPDLLVALIPITVGIFLLVFNFDVVILIAILLLIVLTTSGNGFIRRHLTCKFCKQRDLGCPAERLFNKVEKN